MAGTIRLGAHLEAVKPRIEISEGEFYDINDDKNNVLAMQERFKEVTEEDADLDMATELLNTMLGEEQVAQLEKNHPGYTTKLSTMQVLIHGIMAAINGTSYEEQDPRFQPKEKD